MIITPQLEGIIWNGLTPKPDKNEGIIAAAANKLYLITEYQMNYSLHDFNIDNAAYRTNDRITCINGNLGGIIVGFGSSTVQLLFDNDAQMQIFHSQTTDPAVEPYTSIFWGDGRWQSSFGVASQLKKWPNLDISIEKIMPAKGHMIIMDTEGSFFESSYDFRHKPAYLGRVKNAVSACMHDGNIYCLRNNPQTETMNIVKLGCSEDEWCINLNADKFAHMHAYSHIHAANGQFFIGGKSGVIHTTKAAANTTNRDMPDLKVYTELLDPIQGLASIPLERWQTFADWVGIPK